MSPARRSAETPVLELELHPSLWSCVEPAGIPELEQRSTRAVAALLQGVGVSGIPGVVLRPGTGERAVRAFVEGTERLFPPSFMARLWFGVAPHDLLSLAFDPVVAGKDGGHAWVVMTSSAIAELDREDGRRALCDLVENLAAEVVSLHSGALLSEQEAADYFGDGESHRSLEEPAAVLQWLLELGVWLRERDLLRRVVAGATDLERSAADVCEEALAALRATEIEIHLDERSFDALLDRDGEGRQRLGDEGQDETLVEAMTLVRGVRLSSLGADLPVVFVRAHPTRAGEMQIKVNDRLGPPVPLPAPGEVGVSASPAALEQLGIPARGLVDPVTGAHLSAVAEEHAGAVADAGYVPVLPSAYLVGAFGRAVTALAHRVIAVDRVESMLARFEQDFPVLVHGTLARYSLGELTRLLRELVRERVPIDDLWRILNALVAFDEIEWPHLDGDRFEAALARVRLELADRIVLESCGLAEIGGQAAVVYETDAAFEERVHGWRSAAPSDEELRATRTAVWETLARSGQPTEPVIVTSPGARLLLRRALEDELPDVHVLARSEIPTGVTVERAGVIGDLQAEYASQR